MSKIRHGKLEHGDKVEIYRNLHNDTFSIRRNGKVVKHLLNWMHLYLEDVKFAVQPAGREKVRREGKKNVHAFIRGTIVKAPDNKFGETFKEECTQIAQYNPYKFDTFVTQAWSSKPPAIHRASKVTLNQGTVYAAL